MDKKKTGPVLTEEVLLGDEVIWTREANGDDPIPDYVDAFLSPDAWSGWVIELDGKENYTEFPSPFIILDFMDGRQMVWDLDGNVLSETP